MMKNSNEVYSKLLNCLEQVKSKIDFVPIVKALKEINYKGYFTLECDAYMVARGKNGESEIYNGLKDLRMAVNKLIEMFENQ